MTSLYDPAAGWRVHEIDEHSWGIDLYTRVDVKRAWFLSGALIDIPMSELAYVLHDRSWDGRSPAECGHREPHWTLILEADLAYPIIVTTMPDGSRDVVDGRHRIVKAWLLGHECVQARIVSYDELLSTCRTGSYQTAV